MALASKTQTFDLRALIHGQFETLPDASPAVVAGMVLDLIPKEHLRDALSLCLPSYVMGVAGSIRRTIPEPLPSRPRLTPLVPAVTYNRKGTRVTPTQREKAARQYAAELRWRIAVGDQQWKFLADCTKKDLLIAARFRREQAAGNIAWAERYERLASALSDTQTVVDLPDHLRREAIQ